jgi:hypothetical protein
VEKEKTAGFENTRTKKTRIKDLRKRSIRSFIFDLLATSPSEAKRKRTAEKFFLIPLFLDIRCMKMGNTTTAKPIKKNGFKKERFNSFPYLSAI